MLTTAKNNSGAAESSTCLVDFHAIRESWMFFAQEIACEDQSRQPTAKHEMNLFQLRANDGSIFQNGQI